MVPECAICNQEYEASTCIPAALLCGHCYCTGCLERHSQQSDHPCCPDCRRPYSRQEIIRLFIDFDGERAAETQALPPFGPNVEADPSPMSFTQGQRDEAASIANRMSLLGIESPAAVLVKVLDDVKKWCHGVEAITDLETKVALTRLLLGVDVLQSKVLHGKMLGDKVRTAERALLTSQEKLKTLEAQLNQALADYSRAKQLMDELQANNARLKDKLRVSKLRYKELMEESETREQEIEELRSQLEDTEAERDSLQDAAVDNRKEAEIALQRNRQLERKVKGLDEEIADRESRLRDAKLKIRGIEAQGEARVDTHLSLKSKLRDAESMVAQYSKELETKDSTLANNALQIRKMKQEADHWRDEYFKIRDSDLPNKDQDPPLTLSSPGDSSTTIGPCKRSSSSHSKRNREVQRPTRPNLPVLVDVIPDSEDEPLAIAPGSQSPVGSPSIPRYRVPRARAPSPLPLIRPIKPLPHSKSRNAKRPRRVLELEEQTSDDELPMDTSAITTGDCSPKRKSRRKFSTGSVRETLDRRIGGGRSNASGGDSGIDLI